MKKSERIPALVAGLGSPEEPGLDPFYTGYFTCFNTGQYYEAHDVLEHLWLQCRDENRAFYQGLIQIAGAFVHLRKQYLRPDHPKDGRRLRPAVRLFHLGMTNIDSYGPRHLRLDVAGVCALCHRWAAQIQSSEYAVNPWRPDHAPRIQLLPAD